MNGVDVIITGVYLIVLLSFAKPLLSKILPKFQNSAKMDKANGSFNLNDLKGHSVRSNIKKIAIGVGLAGIVLGMAYGITMLILEEEKRGPWTILIFTTIAIALSFNSKIRNLRGTYKSAEYC